MIRVSDAWDEHVQRLASDPSAHRGGGAIVQARALRGGRFFQVPQGHREGTRHVRLPRHPAAREARPRGSAITGRRRCSTSAVTAATRTSTLWRSTWIASTSCARSIMASACVCCTISSAGEAAARRPFSLAHRDAMSDRLAQIATRWELDSDAPRKLCLILDHGYTKKNLAFRNLKGANKARADTLLRSKAFDLHLALLERVAPPRAIDMAAATMRRRRRRRIADDSEDSCDDDGGHHAMEDCDEDTTGVI